MPEHKVFTYGTLKPSLGDIWGVGEYSEPYEHAVTVEEFVVAGSGFPRAVRKSELDDVYPSGQLKGEIVTVDDNKLSRFDSIEGYPSFYDRIEIEVMTEEGEKKTVLMYEAKEAADFFSDDGVEFLKPKEGTNVMEWND